MKRVKYIVFLIAMSATVFAQVRRDEHNYEIFLFGGGSYYIGDLNQTGHFKFLEPAIGGGLRYNRNPRFAYRAGVWYGHLFADDVKSSAETQRIRNLNFQSRILEGSITGEFNFLPFKPGTDDDYFTPYIFGGVGIFLYDPVVYDSGNKVRLRPLRTEGKAYSLIQPSFPFGMGFKWGLTKRISLSLEWGIRKTLTDYIDDVSTVYPDPSTLNSADAVALSNRVLKLSQDNIDYTGRQRGNSKNKDWYSFTGIMLNIRLSKHEPPCAGVGK